VLLQVVRLFIDVCGYNYGVCSFLVSWGGVRLSSLGTWPLVGLLYQPRLIDDECGVVGGMRIGRGNRSTQRKSALVPLCPPQIPRDWGSNPGRRGGKPATNRLSYATANHGVTVNIYKILATAMSLKC
jgi:hypothetical protein